MANESRSLHRPTVILLSLLFLSMGAAGACVGAGMIFHMRALVFLGSGLFIVGVLLWRAVRRAFRALE